MSKKTKHPMTEDAARITELENALAAALLHIDTRYWFARGYYDGRANGREDHAVRERADEDRHAYRRGYDCGVADHCELDINEEGWGDEE